VKAVGLVLVLAVALAFLLEPVNLAQGQHGPDGRSYLSQLYSLLFEQDMLLYKAKELVGQPAIVTSTGYALELRNIGTALFYLPFYALGQLLCRLSGSACGVADLPVGVSLSLGNWLFGMLALVVIFRLVDRVAPRRWAAVAVAAVGLGSPFVYYWTRFFNPHMPALLLVALLVLVWQRTQAGREWHHWLLMGALGGLAATVASYNVVFLLLPGLDLLLSLPRRRMAAAGDGLLLAAGVLAGLAPQLVTWQLMYGSFLGTPYARQLLWLDPGLPQILLSSYHGLYFYAPALGVATLGFVPLFRQDRALALKALLAFVAHVYVSSCNIAWWAGASFGPRYLLTSLPLLALALGALLAGVRWRGLVCAALAACIFWSYGLLLADFAGLVDPGQYIPLHWQLALQAQVLARLPELVQQHFLTPRFAAAPWVAVPAALLLAGLLALVRRLRVPSRPGFAVAMAVVPLAVALGLALSDGPSQREIARMEAEDVLADHIHADVDVYDLSENYWQRGAYRFVRGAIDGARSDWDTAHELLPARDWVRFHRAGRQHVPHPLAWHVDSRLTLLGWESEPGAVTLYWLLDGLVLEPSYRVEIRLLDAAGQEVAAHVSMGFDPWRALPGDIVRMRYRVPRQSQGLPRTLAIAVYPAHAGGLVGQLEVAFD
jgi:4-amino-4-deoxy-L-arabinose transferase-like glycosyltransferase